MEVTTMFRDMRLKENQLSMEEAIKILEVNSNGVLALSGDKGYAYAVPLNFAYCSNKIYFHCAKTGHKLDAIKNNDKVSFCVVEKDEVIANEFNSLFRSAIAFGTIRVVENESERQNALEILLKKYSSDYFESGKEYIKKHWDRVSVLEFEIEHLTAKQGT
jgi:nitroimidazol reductase NimA-like FMN-containing flavoprotein (pyridoxamine 5'-phosphate oxidase superfamily)